MLTILILTATAAPAQRPDPAAEAALDRRAQREVAVHKAGPGARAFAEAHGEAACAAVSACSPGVARLLAEAHDDGRLARLPSARDLLLSVARPGHGDEVARWALNPANARQLEDVDAFAAYLREPVEYCLRLKRLADGAAQQRARRLSGGKGAGPQAAFPPEDWQKSGLGALAAFVVMLLFRAWERRRAGGGP